jgi:hypothetical protein
MTTPLRHTAGGRLLAFAATLGLAVSVSGAGAQLTINGVALTKKQTAMLRFIAKDVIPFLPGKPEEQLDTAAYAAWWSLREGVLSDWLFHKTNPHLFSLCTRAGKDVLLQPLEPCERGQAWQVGLAAVQAYTPPAAARAQAARVERVRARSWAGRPKTAADVVAETARLAGVDDPIRAQIVALPDGPLRTSWLLRHPVIGFAVVAEQEVKPECFGEHPSAKQLRDCFNTRGQGKSFAATKAAATQTIADLKAFFRGAQESAPPKPPQ